ncbi:autotransporter outer membrane beta-barrel domain-containing protein [Halioxenophilus sp. WMMB6]|uniref:autotransporter outer membrane beta-barrel domain-containing protein n=1 Tax=Halioxenophilus sp. WMMB6 TaxID=3073815 RepID=UPI00295E3B46|nr:autotransporter outer membrane beta-barrel domain-containing protein [Halioxenophilus sp. WMMB6]
MSNVRLDPGLPLFGFAASAGYQLALNEWVTLVPAVGVQLQSLELDEFTEQGGMNLAVEYEDTTLVTANAGVTAMVKPYRLNNHWQVTPTAELGWRHDFSAIEEELTARFDAQSFQQQGYQRDTDQVTLGVGAAFINDSGFNIQLNYSGAFSGDSSRSQVAVGVSYAF